MNLLYLIKAKLPINKIVGGINSGVAYEELKQGLFFHLYRVVGEISASSVNLSSLLITSLKLNFLSFSSAKAMKSLA